MRKLYPLLLVSLLLLLGVIGCALTQPATVTPSPLPSETAAALPPAGVSRAEPVSAPGAAW